MRGTPVPVLGLGAAESISAGFSHSCAVTTSATVSCWGANDSGKLGTGYYLPTTLVTEVPFLTGAVTVVAALNHTCALLNGGSVQCWGSNYYGELSRPLASLPTGDSPRPLGVTLPYRALDITAGGASTCVIVLTREVYCWGANNKGQLGDGSTTDRPTPAAVVGIPPNIVSVSASGASACAVTGGSGALYCWGFNDVGQLGDGSTTDRWQPTQIIASGVASVAMGSDHACAVMRDGGVRCWGAIGTLGTSASFGSYLPRPVRAGQWIDFTPPATFGLGTTQPVAAIASSGGAVDFESWTPSQCAIFAAAPTNVTVTTVGAATCGLRARQGGGGGTGHGSPAPAPQQLRSVRVSASHTVTVVIGSHGSVSPSTPPMVPDGGTLAFAVVPDAGYFATVKTSCGGTLVAGNFTTAAVFADCRVEFIFSTSAVAGWCFDVDGSGGVSGPSAEIDGVLINRYLAGIRGDALVAGLAVIGPRNTGAAVTTILSNIARYDVVGRATPAPTLLVDGLILTRLMRQPIDLATLLNGITIPAGASFTTAASIVQHVSEACSVLQTP